MLNIKIAILSLLLIALCSSNSHAQDFSHFQKEYFEQLEFAHRGGYANGPENSSKTILKNIALDINAIEIDIRMTKDNHLVVFHDETIERILSCDQKLAVSDITLADLKEYSYRNKDLGELYVETLEELLDAVIGKLNDEQKKKLLIELDFKPNGERGVVAIEKMFKTLALYTNTFDDDFRNHFYVATFYPDVLKGVRSQDSLIVTGFAVNNNPNKNKFLARLAILFAPSIMKKNKVSVYEPNMCMLTPKMVKRWHNKHKKGYLINAWTANTSCEKEKLKELKVAFASNCPYDNCNADESDQLGKPKKWCKKCCKKCCDENDTECCELCNPPKKKKK
ncbi:MAG: hypothetical protein GY810_23450 [Aureispira sp.]|nr:hypothetical protein [Aureispira sp.]